MAGLLYKDFISIKGKKLIIGYLVFLIVSTIMRLILPSVFNPIEDIDIDIADMIADALYWSTGMLVFIMVSGMIIRSCSTKLVEDDKMRGRVIDYYSSLPIKKNHYIASHYIFIGIMAYVVFSLAMIWYIVGSALNNSERIASLWSITLPSVLSFVCMWILFVAIDLGANISLGASKGKVVRVAMILLLGTVILWFIFFGDVESVKNMDAKMIVDWMTAHQFEISLFETLGPFVTLAVYYLSFRISCHFCDKGAY